MQCELRLAASSAQLCIQTTSSMTPAFDCMSAMPLQPKIAEQADRTAGVCLSLL